MLKGTLRALWHLFVILKIKWLLTAMLWADSPLRSVNITSTTLLMANQSKFTIMDEPEVKYTQVPTLRQKDPDLVLMVLTAPSNTKHRDAIRQHVSKVKGSVSIQIIFLLGSSNITSKHFNDVLEINVEDSYSTLSYKTLSGFLWIGSFMPDIKYLVKIDDDVRLNWESLLRTLAEKYPHGMPDKTIECSSVMRNMPPWRPRQSLNNHKSIMSKWAVTVKEMPRRVFPDYCPGWAYVTSPSFGLKLVQSANWLIPSDGKIKRLDDFFVTGYLRSRIIGSRIQQLSPSQLWDHYLSECPFLGITKHIFFNDIVLEKGSYNRSPRLYFCAFLEFFILDTIDNISPALIPDFLNKLCSR